MQTSGDPKSCAVETVRVLARRPRYGGPNALKRTAGIPIEVRIHLDALRTQRLEAEMKALATARNASLDVVAFDAEHAMTTRL
jgi:hypothetical protein